MSLENSSEAHKFNIFNEPVGSTLIHKVAHLKVISKDFSAETVWDKMLNIKQIALIFVQCCDGAATKMQKNEKELNWSTLFLFFLKSATMLV